MWLAAFFICGHAARIKIRACPNWDYLDSHHNHLDFLGTSWAFIVLYQILEVLGSLVFDR
jgi:hypothetical protein